MLVTLQGKIRIITLFLDNSNHNYLILVVTLLAIGMMLLRILFLFRPSIFDSADFSESNQPLPIMKCKPGSYEARDLPVRIALTER
jgi:hypothetical protein